MNNKNYELAKIEADRLDAEYSEAGKALNEIVNKHGGPRANGLTPDAVKAMPEWQDAKQRLNEAFQRLRNYNSYFVSTFKKEIKANRKFQ